MFTLKDILDSVVCQISTGADPNTIFKGASIDSRSIQPGEMFFAIRGTGQDGHGFVTSALNAGAAGAVVDRPVVVDRLGAIIIVVSDVTATLKSLATFIRKKYNPITIAITGSAGKTTTKDLIAELLGLQFKVRKSQSSYNNQYGLPLTILGLDDTYSHLVVEIGANHHGEIDELSRVAEPDIGIITNIGYAHIEHFGSLDGTLRAKTELFYNLRRPGTIIVNGDDPLLSSEISKWQNGQMRVLTAGISERCDVRAVDTRFSESGMSGQMRFGSEAAPFKLRFVGRHFLSLALLAVASSIACGMSLYESAEALADCALPPGRLNAKYVDSNLLVLDDTYNGSPDAVLAALRTLSDVSAERRIAVIGEMRELGSFSRMCHEMVGRAAAEVATHLIVVGEGAQYAISEAIRAGMSPQRANVVRSATEALADAQRIISTSSESTAVLIKGSRFTHMERVVLGLGGKQVDCELSTCTKYIHCKDCPLLEVTCLPTC